MTNSIYEILTKLGSPIAKSKIIDQFDGGALTNLWTTSNFGTTAGDAYAMVDTIDEGFSIKCNGTNTNDAGGIYFNNIRNYSNTASVIIGVVRSVTSTQYQQYFGLGNGNTYFDGTNGAKIYNESDNTNYHFETNDTTDMDMGLAIDQSWHVQNIVIGASSAIGTIDGVHSTTSTTNLPSAKLQPKFVTRSITAGGVKEARIRYCEVYNT